MDSDAVVFPSYQFWANGNVVWWDLNYVYGFFKCNRLTNLPKCKWLTDVADIIHRDFGDDVHFHKAPVNSDPGLVPAPIATSLGLLAYFKYFLDAMRPSNPEGHTVVLKILGSLASSAAKTIGLGEQCDVSCRGRTCAVDHNAGVCGFADMMWGLMRHPLQSKRCADTWQDMQRAHILTGAWSDRSHSLHDILNFFCCFERYERKNGRRVVNNNHTTRLIGSSRAAFMTWLGSRTDMYTLATYHANNPIIHRAPPSLRAEGVLKRPRTEVQPEAIWDIIQRAKKARTNVEQAIELKSDEAAFIFRILMFEPIFDF